MPEPRLQPLPGGKIKLGAEHFRKVVRRIECTKPLAGEGIKLKETEDGIEISTAVTGGPGGLSSLDPSRPYGEIELDVCRNGEPDVIYVIGYDPSQNVEPEPD